MRLHLNHVMQLVTKSEIIKKDKISSYLRCIT